MTPALAATTVARPHLPAAGWLTLAALLLAAVLAYVVSCWWWPFAACRVCKGAGKFSRDDRKVWRPCRWCAGTGRRLRVGRWLYNAVRARRDAAR